MGFHGNTDSVPAPQLDVTSSFLVNLQHKSPRGGANANGRGTRLDESVLPLSVVKRTRTHHPPWCLLVFVFVIQL